MKPGPISLIVFALILPLFSLAQAPTSPKLFLRTGTVEPVPNIAQDKLDALHGRTFRLEGKSFAILQFDTLPSESDKAILKSNGIELLFSHFELEVARGNNNYQQNRFSMLARINSSGAPGTEFSYSYMDAEATRAGVYYYRLKMVDRDGQFRYSSIKPVVYSNDLSWQLYPNPAGSIAWLTLQVPEGSLLQLRLIDQSGKIIMQFNKTGSGFPQKIPIDLQGIPAGLYSLELTQGSERRYFRLLRQ